MDMALWLNNAPDISRRPGGGLRGNINIDKQVLPEYWLLPSKF